MNTCFDPEHSAVLLVEFQNQWTLRGSYHRLIREQLASRQVVANAKALVAGARERGVAIIHAPLVIDPARKKGWLAHLTLGKVFTRGTWKAAITDGLFAEGDHLVHDRYALQCVSRTLRTAIARGFDGHLVSDCAATFFPLLQRRVEERLGARVVGYRDLLEAIPVTSPRTSSRGVQLEHCDRSTGTRYLT